MKKLLATSAVISMLAAPAHATPFTLDPGYLRQDGAILSYYNVSAMIDPYFPTKALLTAHDAGLNINSLAHGWINWLLTRQENDGLFSRFCWNEETQNYHACVVADADDSMMAMWLELLYRMAPADGLPVAWRASAHKAQARLDDLFDKEQNVYYISKELPVGLLMDNIEIYAALKRVAKDAKRMGDLRQSAAYYSRAARLKTGIMNTFWDNDNNRFRVSTQARENEVFYPDYVAQLMPMLHGFYTRPMEAPAALYSVWMQHHKEEWMNLIGKDYPWGQIAIIATQQRDMATANCWMQLSSPHRHSGTWDVLDEAAFQSVNKQLRGEWPQGAPACAGVVL